MKHAYLTAVNKVNMVQLPGCHREEPFRATWRSALKLLLLKNGIENLLTADCHTLTGTGAPDGARKTLTGTGTQRARCDCQLSEVLNFRAVLSKLSQKD